MMATPLPVEARLELLTRERLEAVAGVALGAPDEHSPRASGTLEAHYAPRARLRLMPPAMLNTALQMLGGSALKLAVYSRSVPLPPGSPLRWRVMPVDPDRAAHELFATLRELDAEGPDLIWVEEPPPLPAWDGVRDRLGTFLNCPAADLAPVMNATVALAIIAITGGKAVDVSWDHAAFPYLNTVKWPKAGSLSVLVQNREQTKAQLLAMQDGQRVARFAENGERVVLDDAEHEAEVERLSKYVARNCK